MAKYRSRKPQTRIDALLIEIWVLCFLPCYLLLCSEKGFSGISAFKTKLLYGFAAVLAALVLSLLILRLALPARTRARVLQPLKGPTAAQLAALAYLLFALVSTLLSPCRQEAFYNKVSHENLVTQGCYVLIFLAVSRWGRLTKRSPWVFFATLSALLLVSLLQLMNGNPLGLFPGKYTYYSAYVQENGPFLGTIGNVDLYSALMSLALPICLVCAAVCFRKDRGPSQGLRAAGGILCLVLFGAGLYCMVKTKVLCGLVGLAAGGLLAALVLIPRSRRGRWLALGWLALAGVGFAVFLWFYSGSFRFFRELHLLLHGQVSDRFGSGRFYIWRQMLERLRSDPHQLLFGSGPDTVRTTGLQPFVRYNEAGQIVKTARITDAHCLPLHILYCEGVFALLAWLALLACVLVPWFRRGGGSVGEKALGAGLLCFLIAMLFSFSSVIIMPFFWLALGLLHGEQIRKEEPQCSNPQNGSRRRR